MRSILIALAMATSVQSAAFAEFQTVAGLPLKDIRLAAAEQSVPTAKTTEATPVREWTVMLFMNGRSNVESFALTDMNKIEAAGSSDHVNVVVELGRMRGQDGDTTADGDWTGSRRYYVVKDTDTEHITSPVLMETPKVDMGDWHRVVDFVQWSKQNFPAKHYMLLIWDHGWGWLDPTAGAFGTEQHRRSISHDFENHSYISTMDLGKMLKATGGVDVYASMACFMQMAEIGWEMKDSAKVIVGSEEVVQLASFDFTAILNQLEASPSASPERVGEIMVDTFHDLYSKPEMLASLKETKYGVTLSAIRAPLLGGLKPLIDAWVPLALSVNDTAAMAAAKTGVVRMEIGDETSDPKKLISFYGDLGNFMEIYAANLKTDTPQGTELKARTLALVAYLDKALVIKRTGFSQDRTGKDYALTRGLAIDIPGEPGVLIPINNNYFDLGLAKETKWGDFVKWQTPAK